MSSLEKYTIHYKDDNILSFELTNTIKDTTVCLGLLEIVIITYYW